jgi:Helix-turn-helix domain
MSRYPKKITVPRTTDELVKEIFLTVPEAAQVARVCEAAMWNMLADGKVKSVKIGVKRLVDTASLLDFLANLPVSLAIRQPRQEEACA